MRRIGSLEIASPFVLAPLAGITDAPMRLLAKEQGASLCYTEMISVKGLLYHDKNTETLLYRYEEEGPVGIQLFGNDPEEFKRVITEYSYLPFELWDINMGCPVPKIVKNGEGSALLKNPKLAASIVEAAVSVAERPVTVKMRIGWDDESINGVEFAKDIAYAGASAIAVHGRTRAQMYTGRADRDIIGEIRASVNIPVIANGDIFTASDAMTMMDETGCDMVMIARGAMGNPWIFRDCNALFAGREAKPGVSAEELRTTVIRHAKMLAELKGERRAVPEMRKHAGWYLKGRPGAAAFRKRINSITGLDELIGVLKEIRI